MRGDDAVGLLAARELEKYFRNDANVTVIACQQLAPEMAEDIAQSELVIFVDASHFEEAGAIRCTLLRPEGDRTGFTHQLNPPALLGAAEQLYGDVPEAFTVTLGGWSYDLTNVLSEGARTRLSEVVRRVVELVATGGQQISSRTTVGVPAGRP